MSIDLSLERICKLLNHLPVPYTRPTVHVAGTNGKGSVCALVSSILSSATPPLVVGRFNSPHLLSPLDGISVGGKPIDKDTFMEARGEVRRINDENAFGASMFELYACFALLIFERRKVDVVVLEVGMGGRLDATNVVPDECILVSALTSVALDHQAILGNTIEAITREKAAIARPEKPFVVAPQVHPQVVEVAKSVVESLGGELVASCTVSTVEWDTNLDGPLPPTQGIQVPLFQPVHIFQAGHRDPIRALLPLQGEHQIDNLRTAMAIISALQTHSSCDRPGINFAQRLSPDAISRGIRATRWPGRLSYHTISLPTAVSVSGTPNTSTPQGPADTPILVLADGAHNPAAATAVGAYISSVLEKTGSRPLALTYILALSHSPPKTPEQTLKPLLAVRDSLRLAGKREVRLGVALLPFTPPLNMPWIKFVPPADMRPVVESLVSRSSCGSDSDSGSGASAEMEVEVLESSSDFSGLETVVAPTHAEPPRTEHVEEALRWAAGRRREGEDAFVVLSGSLYLVADFYRLLEKLGQAREIWGAN
uniref:Zn(2)-C6 fungal-type domain-containing protein n=1 Tax=Ganoderma boninense TaxID=34458 RepID=A0A5K1JV45_9APHY|nr:Zn(2)-C6 fungal-type domain-containing protein [Ganoderma boninense]